MAVKEHGIISMLNLKYDQEDVLDLAVELKEGEFRGELPLKARPWQRSSRSRVSVSGSRLRPACPICSSSQVMQMARNPNVSPWVTVNNMLSTARMPE